MEPEVSQNVGRMQFECSQNVARIKSDCSQNVVRMSSECRQNVVRMQSEYDQNVVRMWLREIDISLELADMQLSLLHFSVFSSFCLFIFLSFRIFIFLSFRLFVYLSICHLRSSQVIGGPIRIINHERPSSMLGVDLMDWIGIGWLSQVVGILRAPMVLMKAIQQRRPRRYSQQTQ